MGLYKKLVDNERTFFKQRYILVDGGVFTVKPWQSLAEIEKKLFPNEQNLFFIQKRFHKRSDGYYCLIKDISKFEILLLNYPLFFVAKKPTLSNLVCMPTSKGRSKGEIISPESRKKLEELYYPVNREIGVDLSWLQDFSMS